MSVISKASSALRRANIFGQELVMYRNCRTIGGFLSKEECVSLFRLARMLPRDGDADIVEIGSWMGRSTYALASGLARGKVHAIDPFVVAGDPQSIPKYAETLGGRSLLEVFCNNMQRLGVKERVHVCQGISTDFANKFEKIDLLFIDGDHSIEGCKVDYQLFYRAITKGGILAFHDYDSRRKDLGPTFVIETMVMPSLEFDFIGLYGSLWVARKR